MGLQADLTNADYKVDALEADFVRDWVRFRWVGGPDDQEHYISFVWDPSHTPQDAIDAIDAAVAVEDQPDILSSPPGTPEDSDGTGLELSIDSASHPGAEVERAELDTGSLSFRWIGGPYRGDCAISYSFTLSTTAQDISDAISGIVPK